MPTFHFSWWSEGFLRHGCVSLAHQKSKPRAGPRKAFTHSPRRVGLDHCLNAGAVERALGQVRLSAATERLDDHKLRMLHRKYYMPGALRWTFHLMDF